jgi:hypothetical protein
MNPQSSPISPQSDFHPRNVYVAGLPIGFPDSALEEIFAPYGKIQSAKMMRHNQVQKGKGIGFVLYESEESATAAIQNLVGRVVEGEPLVIRRARISKPPAKQRAMVEKALEAQQKASASQPGPNAAGYPTAIVQGPPTMMLVPVSGSTSAPSMQQAVPPSIQSLPPGWYPTQSAPGPMPPHNLPDAPQQQNWYILPTPQPAVNSGAPVSLPVAYHPQQQQPHPSQHAIVSQQHQQQQSGYPVMSYVSNQPGLVQGYPSQGIQVVPSMVPYGRGSTASPPPAGSGYYAAYPDNSGASYVTQPVYVARN